MKQTYSPRFTVIDWERLTIYEYDTLDNVKSLALLEVSELLGVLNSEKDKRQMDELKRQGEEY